MWPLTYPISLLLDKVVGCEIGTVVGTFTRAAHDFGPVCKAAAHDIKACSACRYHDDAIPMVLAGKSMMQRHAN